MMHCQKCSKKNIVTCRVSYIKHCLYGAVLLALLMYLFVYLNSAATRFDQHWFRFQKSHQLYDDNAIAEIFTQKCGMKINNDDQMLELLNLTSYTDTTTDYEVMRITNERDCRYIIRYYSFEVDSANFTIEERNYSIAYSILAHQNMQQLMLLLSQIYAPHNVYCIHLDAKSPLTMLRTLERVQDCFPNIHLASKRERVVYASFSRLQADINCMHDLLQSPVLWIHLVNLSGQVSKYSKFNNLS